jgi:beta-fructofuranosidase
MNRREFILSSSALAFNRGISSALAGTAQSAMDAPDPALRARLMHDPLRPQFHLLPQAGFVGDPCAPQFHRGQYHVFYHGSFGGKGWHHAISSDLIHWKHMPIALAPTPGSFDSYGTFTGSVLPGGDHASIIYTGVTRVPAEQETIRNEGLREVQCIATSMDMDLRSFTKLEMPVIDGPPPGLKVVGFRDPFSWKEDDTWFVGVGSGFSQIGGAVLLYRSRDARRWEYLHPLAQGTWNGESSSNPVPSGEMWECPDFFPLGDKHVLIYSSEHTTFWEVGTYDRRELRFHAERKGCLDHGAFYAPKSMLDSKMRRVLWGWVQETRSRDEIEAAGWSGCVSLPRVLTLGADNHLLMEVAPEFASLRTNTVTIEKPRDSPELQNALSRAIVRNRSGEIRCVFKISDSSFRLELRLGSNNDADALLAVNYDGTNDQPFIAIGVKILPLDPDSNGLSSLHILIDGSVVETFVDRRHALTTRSYAAPAETREIHIVWSGTADALQSLIVSDLKPISNDRLTS